MSENQTPVSHQSSETHTAALETVHNQTLPEETRLPSPETKPQNEQQSNGKTLSIIALAVSLVAVSLGGVLMIQGKDILESKRVQLDSMLNQAALGNSENARLLNENRLLNEKVILQNQDLQQQIVQTQEQQKKQYEQLERVNVAYAQLLKGRLNWLVDEVEVTLNVASQQLLLSGNVPVSVSVLENVEQRLNRFEQAELLPIKKAISQDLSALKERPYLNVAAATLRLDRLQNAVSGLPLVLDDTLKVQNVPESESQAHGFWQRTWENTLGMMRGMVEVRHLESNDKMLLAPEQVYFVRENLRLRLLNARLALLQHNGELFQSDLNAVESTVKQYFDVQSPNIQSWLKELGELKSLEIRMVSDEALKNSLAAVRHYQNNVRTALPILPDAGVNAVPVIAPSVNVEMQNTSQSASQTEPKLQAVSVESPSVASQTASAPKAKESANPVESTSDSARATGSAS